MKYLQYTSVQFKTPFQIFLLSLLYTLKCLSKVRSNNNNNNNNTE